MYLRFYTNLHIRKPLISLTTLVFFMLITYITFSTSRTILSTLEGYEYTQKFDISNAYILNLDPSSDVDLESISDKNLTKLYDYLNNTHQYAFYTDGYIANITNNSDFEIPVSYMNENFMNINGFPIIEGNQLDFNYDIEANDPLTALVGAGLASEYPIGSLIPMNDPVTNKDITVEVVGVLKENAARSNYYALDSKQYYNYSIVLPVNEHFINYTDSAFKINGLMDLIILNTSNSDISKLIDLTEESINVKFNYFSQQQNNEYYYEYFFSSMISLVFVSSCFILLLIIISIWNSLISLKLLIPELTINLLLGLSYIKLKKIYYFYYGLLSLLSSITIIAFTAYSRYSAWIEQDTFFITLGYLGGLISMDWIAIFIAFMVNTLLTVLIVEIISWRIRQIPISMGVLQQ